MCMPIVAREIVFRQSHYAYAISFPLSKEQTICKKMTLKFAKGNIMTIPRYDPIAFRFV